MFTLPRYNILLLAATIALSARATDIVPNPASPGNLGSATNPFVKIYGGAVTAGSVTVSNGLQVPGFSYPSIDNNNQARFVTVSNWNGTFGVDVLGNVNANSFAGSVNASNITGLKITTASTIYNSYLRQAMPTFLSPLQNADWLYTSDARIPTFHGDSWNLNENGLANDRYYVFALPVPLGTTNIVYSYSCKALTGSVAMKTEIYCPYATAISQSNQTVTTSYSTIAGSVALPSTWTNTPVVQFFLRPQGAVAVSTNITITFQPAPAGLLGSPFTRVAVLPKNIARDAGSGNAVAWQTLLPYFYELPPYDISATRASTYSYVDIETDATNLMLEEWSANQGVSSYSVSGAAGLAWGTNYNTFGNAYYPSFLPVSLSTNKNQTVRIYSGYAAYGYGQKNVLRAIYVPQGNFVKFKKESGGRRVLLIGDSRLCSVNVSSIGMENTLGSLIEQYFPCEVYTFAMSGAPLNALWGNANNKQAFLKMLTEINPTDVWDEYGYIDWAMGNGTNQYLAQQSDMLDTIHELVPSARVFVQPFDYNTLDGLTNGSYQADYNLMASVAVAPRTNFAVYLNWTNQLSGLKADGVHDTEAGTGERAYLMYKQLYTNTLTPTGLSARMMSNLITAKPVTLGFGGARNGSAYPIASAGMNYFNPFGGIDNGTRQVGEVYIPAGTYTNFIVNHSYPNWNAGTNVYYNIYTNGVLAMQAVLAGPATASANNICSNTTSSFTLVAPALCTIGITNNSGGPIAGPFVSWTIQKY